MQVVEEQGIRRLRISIGGDGSAYNSVIICNENFDTDEMAYLDFKIRTSSNEAAAIMFQIEGSEAWYSLNLIGQQNLFTNLDSLKQINDGQWHRVTWNLKRLVRDKFNNSAKIKTLILGSWENSQKPVVIELAEMSLGKRNMLN